MSPVQDPSPPPGTAAPGALTAENVGDSPLQALAPRSMLWAGQAGTLRRQEGALGCACPAGPHPACASLDSRPTTHFHGFSHLLTPPESGRRGLWVPGASPSQKTP